MSLFVEIAGGYQVNCTPVSILLILLAIYAVAYLYEGMNGRRDVRLLYRHIRHDAFGRDDLKIVLVSDLHDMDIARYRPDALDRIREFEPDMIALCGDVLPIKKRSRDWLEKLAGTGPCYFVSGNNEYNRFFTKDGEVAVKAKQLGFIPVLNRGLSLECGSKEVFLAGVSDPHLRKDDISRALENAPAPGRVPCILLAHSPAIWYKALRKHVDLVLCGHTHHGQIKLPIFNVVWNHSRMPARFSEGIIREEGTVMVVGGGLGTSLFPLRIGCPPEILFLTVSER